MPSDEFRRYALAGVTLQSEVPLPELRDASTPAAPDWTFRLGSRKPALPTERWFHHWRAADGRRWLSVGRQRDAYVLRFARTATFRLSPDARTILCDGAARVPARMMRHLFLNQVFPLALTRVDRLVLHASAVVAGAGTVGFAGQTGSGKSTLAAALSCVGAPLVSDDALVADRSDDGFVTAPMYDAVRLWPDSLAALCGTMADRGSPAFARG